MPTGCRSQSGYVLILAETDSTSQYCAMTGYKRIQKDTKRKGAAMRAMVIKKPDLLLLSLSLG